MNMCESSHACLNLSHRKHTLYAPWHAPVSVQGMYYFLKLHPYPASSRGPHSAGLVSGAVSLWLLFAAEEENMGGGCVKWLITFLSVHAAAAAPPELS